MNPYLKHLNKIEFVITNACTGRCKHCSEGDHTSCGEHIHPQIAADAVRSIAAEYDLKTVMTFGGEPLLYPDAVYAVMAAAKDLHIPKRQIITNGYFSRNAHKMADVAERLAACGVNDLLLSVDAFHQETIPLDVVQAFAAEVQKAGIPLKLQPAWLVSETDDNPYNRQTREILDSFADMSIPVGDGNVIFPEGNAAKYLAEYFTGEIPENPYAENPCDLHCVSFSPNGDVLGGNVYRCDVMEILNRYKPPEAAMDPASPSGEDRDYLVSLLLQNDVTAEIRKETDRLLSIIPTLRDMMGFEHCHPHHHLDVWEHTLLALSLSPRHLPTRLALLLHDLGKPYCYQQEGEFRHFKGHPERSADMAHPILTELGFDTIFVDSITELIRRHDTPLRPEDVTADPLWARELFAVQVCDALAHNPAHNKKRLAYISEMQALFAQMGVELL